MTFGAAEQSVACPERSLRRQRMLIVAAPRRRRPGLLAGVGWGPLRLRSGPGRLDPAVGWSTARPWRRGSRTMHPESLDRGPAMTDEALPLEAIATRNA